MRIRFGAYDSHRGSAIIGILIVVVIILVVIMLGPFSRTSVQNQVPQAISDIEKAAAATCMNNRRATETELTQIQISNDGKLPPMPILQQRLGRFRCPRGGAIVIGKDGKVYCTKHDPPPIDELKDMIPLFEEQKEATPPPLPKATPMH